ncbi:MAG: hypothetical protein AAGE59_21315 [Cyanobacteria bacterium P01_F01_bin.86]
MACCLRTGERTWDKHLGVDASWAIPVMGDRNWSGTQGSDLIVGFLSGGLVFVLKRDREKLGN